MKSPEDAEQQYAEHARGDAVGDGYSVVNAHAADAPHSVERAFLRLKRVLPKGCRRRALKYIDKYPRHVIQRNDDEHGLDDAPRNVALTRADRAVNEKDGSDLCRVSSEFADNMGDEAVERRDDVCIGNDKDRVYCSIA